MFGFTEEQIRRYSRQIILPDVGGKGQKKLLESRVLLIGAGGLGSPAGLYLAAAGVGTLAFVDFDVVDISNLHRQILHTTEDDGASHQPRCGGDPTSGQAHLRERDGDFRRLRRHR